MKNINNYIQKLIFCSLLVSFPLLAASPQQSLHETVKQRASSGLKSAQSYLKKISCTEAWKKGAATVSVIGLIGAAAVVNYNREAPKGDWTNTGTAELPSYIPETAQKIGIKEKARFLIWDNRRPLYVESDGRGFGKVIYVADKLQHWANDQLIAETSVVSPYGRPYRSDLPIKINIWDGSGHLIGSIEEFTTELDNLNYQVSYRLRDPQGALLADTSSYTETDTGEILEGKLNLKVSLNKIEQGEFSRIDKLFSQSYSWTPIVQAKSDQKIDPRLMILLSAYSSLTSEIRAQ